MTKESMNENTLFSSIFDIPKDKTFTDFIVEKFCEVIYHDDPDINIIVLVVKKILPRIFSIIEVKNNKALDIEAPYKFFNLLKIDGFYEYSITGLITRLLFDEDLLDKIFNPEQVEKLLGNKEKYINGKFACSAFLDFNENGIALDNGEEYYEDGDSPPCYQMYEKIIHTTICLTSFKLIKNDLLNEDYYNYCEWEDNYIRFVKELFVDEDSFIRYFDFKINLRLASDELRNNHEGMLAAVKKKGTALQYASEKLRNDREIVLAAVINDSRALEFASEVLRTDPDILEVLRFNMLIRFEGHALEYAPEELRNDRDFVLAVVKKNGSALEYAPEELCNDMEIVLTAVNTDGGSVLTYASKELCNNREFILAAVKKDEFSSVLDYASKQMLNDREFILAAVKINGNSLKYAPKKLRNDREIVLTAIKSDSNYFSNGGALQYASEELRNEKEIVMAAVNKDGNALKHASDELRNDREIVLTAVKQDKWGFALKYASAELRNEREIVFAAVKQKGCSLQYTSGEFRKDREIVLAAVKQNGHSLEFASKELQNDTEIVLAATNEIKTRKNQ